MQVVVGICEVVVELRHAVNDARGKTITTRLQRQGVLFRGAVQVPVILIEWLDALFNEYSANIMNDISHVMYTSDAVVFFGLKTFSTSKIMMASFVIVEEVELVLDAVVCRDVRRQQHLVDLLVYDVDVHAKQLLIIPC